MKITYELASRIRDELLNDDQRVLLTSVVGTRYIDFASRFMSIYKGYKLLATSEEQFMDDVARLLEDEGTPILEKLRVKNEELDNLMKVKKFNREGTSFATSNTNLINDFESKNTTRDTTGAFAYDFTESSAQARATALVRGASTQTSQRNKGLENQWKKDFIVDVSTQLVGKKEFDPNKVLQEDKVLDVREAHYEIVPEEKPIPEDMGAELYGTISVGGTGNASSNYGASNNETLSLARTDGVTDSTSNTYSNTDYQVSKEYSTGTYNENVMKILRLQIPDLRSQFFNIFSSLFDT